MTPNWKNAKRIVVKIGSSLLVNQVDGGLKHNWLASVIADIAQLKVQGKEVIIVSSGAIGLGRKRLGLPFGALKLEQSQAAAAVGQVALTHAYEELLSAQGLITAQVLLTLGDTEERRRYLNARSTIQTLLGLGVVAVVNENDTVATSEIRYGDNDRLAARVAAMISADVLVLLSDIDGLYTAPPATNPDAQHLAEISIITPEIEAMAGSVGSDFGSGGMITKIMAGRIATDAGSHMVISSGLDNHPLKAISDGTRCSWFLAQSNPVKARKLWIAGSLKPRGTLTLDQGASAALRAGKSLLPAGVTDVQGEFERGDAVQIIDHNGARLARGLTAYGHTDANKIIGHHSREIPDILGYQGRTALVHRDDLVMTKRER